MGIIFVKTLKGIVLLIDVHIRPLFIKLKKVFHSVLESDAASAAVATQKINIVGQVKNLIEGNIHYRDGTPARPRKTH